MTVMPNDKFAAHVMKLAQNAPPFQPTATYDPDGDCIEFLASPDPFYAERVDELVTVYYSQESREVIGSQIKCVKRFCQEMVEKLPGLKIEIHDGPVTLEHIFLAKLWTADPQLEGMARLTYRKLIEVAGQSEAKADLACV